MMLGGTVEERQEKGVSILKVCIGESLEHNECIEEREGHNIRRTDFTLVVYV